MRRTARVAWVTVAAIALLATTVQAGTPVKVVDTAAYEFGSAAGGDWVAWSRGPGSGGDHDLSVKQTGQPADVIEAGRSQQVGNIELGGPHGDILVFDIGPGAGDRDIRFYDLGSGNVTGPPAGINSDRDDELPSISGNYLLFSRGPAQAFFAKQVYLYDFTTTDLTLIASAPTGGTATSDSIRGNFASYTLCPSTGKCNVFRYRISTGGRTRMPNPDRATYWSSVLADGTVYFVQGSPTRCGRQTKIMRFRNGAVTNLHLFTNGIEIADLDAVDDGIEPTVYFTRIRCNGLPGIWKIAG